MFRKLICLLISRTGLEQPDARADGEHVDDIMDLVDFDDLDHDSDINEDPSEHDDEMDEVLSDDSDSESDVRLCCDVRCTIRILFNGLFWCRTQMEYLCALILCCLKLSHVATLWLCASSCSPMCDSLSFILCSLVRLAYLHDVTYRKSMSTLRTPWA